MGSVDVAIVGGGVIGLSLAMRLGQAGASVSLFDQAQPGEACSSAGAGLLMAQTETRPPIPGALPDPMLRAGLQARALYPEFLDAVEELSGGRPAFRLDGTCSLALHEDELFPLTQKVSWQLGLGLSAELIPFESLHEIFPEDRVLGAAHFPHDGWVDNQTLMPLLVDAVRRVATLHPATEVHELTRDGARITGVRTRSGVHSAGQVVLAAGAWSENLLPPSCPRLGVRPARGHLLHMDTLGTGPELPIIAGDYYVVPRPHGQVLLGSTVQEVGFDLDTPAVTIAEIRAGVERFLPEASRWDFIDAWSGLRPRPSDDLPVVGRDAETGLWFATGHFRNGILHAPLTAAWLSEGIISGGMPPEAEPFSPSRFRPGRLEVTRTDG